MLRQYVSGVLDELRAEEIDLHLSQCSHCQERVDEQTPRRDSMLEAIRHPGLVVSPAEQTVLNKLIRHAQTVVTPSEPELVPESRPAEPVALDIFVSCLNKSGLLNPSEVELLVETHQPNSTDAFAKDLIAHKKLTPFQAKVLSRGRWKGLVLGNYVILDNLGKGGMGTVFKARHRRMGRVVCLKVLHAAHRKSPHVRERFRREAKTVAALQHPNIVVAHDADEANGIPFLVMEFVQGSDLAQRVSKEGPLPANLAIEVVLQAARALEHAHNRGVIHRDIKPHNLLIDEGGSVKILDMGLARFDTYLGQNPDATTHASMTVSGIIMGTVDYMAPEQALNSRRADHRSDIYSLGCTFHFLLTGKVVYDGGTLMERLIAHREQAVPNLQASAGINAVFQRMVAKDPARRYRSMAELVLDLEALQAGRAPAALGSLKKRRSRVMPAVAAVVSLAAIGFSLWSTRAMWMPPSLAEEKKVVMPEKAPLVGHPGTRANGGPGRALLVLPHDWFIEEHYTTVEKALKSRGIGFAVTSSKAGTATPKHGQCPPVPIELTLDKFDTNDFDAVVFLSGNFYEFTKNKANADQARQVVAEALDKGLTVAGVDNGIMILDDGRFTSEASSEQQGGCWISRPPRRKGMLVTTKETKYLGNLVQTMFP